MKKLDWTVFSKWLVLSLLVACISYLAVTSTINRLYPVVEPSVGSREYGLECAFGGDIDIDATEDRIASFRCR